MPHTVAIVEDDPRLLAELAGAVRSAPDLELVGEAADVPEALFMLRRRPPDVLLVDLGLPSGSGIELIRFAAAQLPLCEVMVLTLFGDQRNVLDCLEAGATGYLLKGTQGADIAEHIRVLRAGGSPISPSIARQLLTRFAGARPAGDGAGESPRAGMEEPQGALSDQERSVLGLSAKGYTYEEIAGLLGLSSHTVKTYVKRIYRKLQVHGKTEAVYEARKLKWLQDS